MLMSSKCLTHWLYIIKMDRVIMMSSIGFANACFEELDFVFTTSAVLRFQVVGKLDRSGFAVYLVCLFAPICVGCTRDGNDWILSAAWAQMTTHPLARPLHWKFCICKIKVYLMNFLDHNIFNQSIKVRILWSFPYWASLLFLAFCNRFWWPPAGQTIVWRFWSLPHWSPL